MTETAAFPDWPALDAIRRDLDAATDAWVASGYGYDTPQAVAREAVFARLRAWNERWARS